MKEMQGNFYHAAPPFELGWMSEILFLKYKNIGIMNIFYSYKWDFFIFISIHPYNTSHNKLINLQILK